MVHLLQRNSILLMALGFSLWPTAGSAHTVKASESVAVTYHLEPDHNPRAGAPAQVWFVLTQKGGAVIPLDQCDCQLQVYSEQDPSGSVMSQPPLVAIAAEQYQGIPGADVTFPQPGAYRLVFQGRPQRGDLFKPFQFEFPVTVAKGTTPLSSPQALASAPRQVAPPSNPSALIWVGVSLGLGLLGLAVWQRWQR